MSSSKQTQSSTQTVTPNVPQWIQDSTQQFTGKIGDYLGQDPSKFVAGPQGVNQSIFDLAGGFSNAIPDLYKSAQSQIGGVGQAYGYNPQMMTSATIGPVAQATAATAEPGISTYINPYTQQVIQPMLRDAAQSLGIAQNSVGNDAILAGGYGGSRQGIAQGLTNSEWMKNLDSALGNLRYQGFNTALGAANSDADRAQQVSLANAAAQNTASLSQAQLDQQANVNNQNANDTAWQYNAGANDAAQNRNLAAAQLRTSTGNSLLDFLSGAGGTQQNIAQNQAQAPLSVLQLLTGAYGNLPLDQFIGKTVTGNGTSTSSGSLLDTIGKLAGTAASVAALSDGRLKRDVETVGYDAKGRRWVDYRYTWDAPDAPKRRGVIAQEVLETDPDAVSHHPTGFLQVDYGALH